VSVPLAALRSMRFPRCKYIIFSDIDLRPQSEVKSDDAQEFGMRKICDFLRTKEGRLVSCFATLCRLESQDKKILHEILLCELLGASMDNQQVHVEPYSAWNRTLRKIKSSCGDRWLQIAAASICVG